MANTHENIQILLALQAIGDNFKKSKAKMKKYMLSLGIKEKKLKQQVYKVINLTKMVKN